MGAPRHILPKGPARLERSVGKLTLGFRTSAGKTGLGDLYQQGCLKARFPRQFTNRYKTGVLINTTGGIADGDCLDTDIALTDGAQVVLTTQAAERVYKAANIDDPAKVSNRMAVGAAACLYWLPQETIVFDGGSLARTYDVDIAEGAKCLMAEMTVFGRVARGEAVDSLSLFDRWRIKHAGRLVFADGFRLGGDIATPQVSAARLQGATAIATLFSIGPECAAKREILLECFDGAACAVGCTLRGELLIARIAGANPSDVRAAMMKAIAALDADRGMASPVLSRWIF